MNQTIYYFRRQNYGNTHFYFAKKSHRKAYRMMTGNRTFNVNCLICGSLDAFKAFGNFEFVEVLESSPEVEPINPRVE